MGVRRGTELRPRARALFSPPPSFLLLTTPSYAPRNLPRLRSDEEPPYGGGLGLWLSLACLERRSLDIASNDPAAAWFLLTRCSEWNWI